jgi:hypothetical protein
MDPTLSSAAFIMFLRISSPPPLAQGSHYDPECDLFVPSERNMVLSSDACMLGMLGVLALATAKLGAAAMFNLYFVPYWVFVMWLDTVTYLQHHGSSDPQEKLPWYRCVCFAFFFGFGRCLACWLAAYAAAGSSAGVAWLRVHRT